MTRQTAKIIFFALLLGAFAGGTYVGYRLGRDARLPEMKLPEVKPKVLGTKAQDSLYCLADHTRTLVHLAEDLKANELSMALGFLESNIDSGVLQLTSGAEKSSEEVQKTLVVVRDYRRKHPWMGSSVEQREQVKRALANVP